MIFITLGTFEMKFERILREIEKLDIKEEVIIQSGYTNFNSNKYKIFKFMDKEEFKDKLNKADLVICHGGVGSIIEAINNNKKVISIPRLAIYNEHVDDHQVEIVEKFTREGYIISSKCEKDLEQLIKKSENFKFKKYKSQPSRLVEKLDMYIQSI